MARVKPNKIISISNIFPEEKKPYQAPFVKTIHENLLPLFDQSNLIYCKTSDSRLLRIFNYLIFFSKVFMVMTEKKTTVLFFHFPSITCMPLIFSANRLGSPQIILNIHGFELYPDGKLSCSQRFARNYTMKKALTISDGVVVPSQYYKKEVTRLFDCEDLKKKIFVSPSGGVDSSFFNIGDSKRSKTLPEYCPHLIFIGRLIKNKGILEAIESVRCLKNQADYRFTVIGSGPLSDQVRVARDNAIIDSWIEYGSRADIRNLLEIADCSLFLSIRKGESLGLVAIESLAAGVPVIALGNGAVREFIEPHKNGLIIDSLDPQELIEAIKEVTSHNKKNQMRKRNLVSATVSTFSRSEVGENLRLELSKVLKLTEDENRI